MNIVFSLWRIFLYSLCVTHQPIGLFHPQTRCQTLLLVKTKKYNTNLKVTDLLCSFLKSLIQFSLPSAVQNVQPLKASLFLLGILFSLTCLSIIINELFNHKGGTSVHFLAISMVLTP